MMVSAQIERIGPDVAAAMLGANADNRRISEIIVAQYAADMVAGQWQFTGQPIIISDDGQLNDGQHRLAAVVKAGVPLDMMVVRGAPRSSRAAIDTGKSRTAGDVVQMFHIPNGNAVAALANMVLAWERAGKKTVGTRYRNTKTDIIARARSDERLLMADRFSYQARSICMPRQAGFARYVIPDSDTSTAFFERLVDGVGLHSGSPILAVRQWFLRNGRKLPDAPACEALLRAWAAYRDGRELTRIQIMGELPTP